MLYRWMFPLLLAFSLVGAPFGMGRMMDGSHGAAHAAMMDHSAHLAHAGHDGMKGRPQADHPASSPHFVVCAACIGALAQAPQPMVLSVLTGHLIAGTQAAWTGVARLPQTPPPRA